MLRLLLDGGHSAKAGQIAGAFRRIGRPQVADEIVRTMKSAGYDVRETDPFAPEQTFGALPAVTAPIVGRMQAMWESMRGAVVETFPKAPGLPRRQERVSALRGRYLQERRLPLAVNRGVQRHAGS